VNRLVYIIGTTQIITCIMYIITCKITMCASRCGSGGGSRGGGVALVSTRQGIYNIIIIITYTYSILYALYIILYCIYSHIILYNIMLFCLFWLSSLWERASNNIILYRGLGYILFKHFLFFFYQRTRLSS